MVHPASVKQEGDDMSLFTHEEVCKDCVFSRWIPAESFWDEKSRFAKCEIHAENQVDSASGTCPSREEEKSDG